MSAGGHDLGMSSMAMDMGAAVVERLAFLGRMDAIRDVLSVSAPVLASRDLGQADHYAAEVLNRTFAGLSTSDLLGTQEAFTSWLALMEGLANQAVADPQALDRTSADVLGVLNQSLESLNQVIGEPSRLVSLIFGIGAAATRPARGFVLGQALVMTAVSAYEQYLVVAARALLRRQPRPANDEHKWESKREKEFAARVRALPQAWSIFREHGFDPYACGGDSRAVNEAVERRHVYTHAAGRATRAYVKRVQPPDVRVDQLLEADAAYVLRTVDSLTSHGLLLVAAAERAASWPNHAAEDLFHREVVDTLMQSGRWEIVEAVCATGKMWPGRLQRVYQVNQWVAVKRLRGLDQIRSDAEAFVSGDDLEELARLVLLERDVEAVSLLRKLIDGGTLTKRRALDWVLLDELKGRNEEARALLQINTQPARFGTDPQ